MKVTSRILALLLVFAMVASTFSGCGLLNDDEDIDEIAVLAESVETAIAEACSVEASIFLEIQAHIGTTGTTGSHTAAVESDITVTSTFAPYAYHSESFSRILVDSTSTREDTESYVVPSSNSIDYLQYDYNVEQDAWTQQTLSRSEAEALSLKTCLMHNWEDFFRSARLEYEGTDCNGKVTDMYTGVVDSSILQEVINDGIFGSFLYSVEQLLNDELDCTLYIEQETNLPVQMTISFDEAFTVTDMTFDNAMITVDYSDWGKTTEISVPKKVTVVASDPEAEFYASYFAWNLFLPYLQSASGNQGNNQGGNQAFTSSWETFQIRIDNGMTTLPIHFADLDNLGYTIDTSYENIIIEPNMYVEDIPVYKNRDLVYCVFYNDGTEATPITSCKIGQIDIASSDQQENGISVFLPGNVCLGSTLEFVNSAYGTADEISKSFSADTHIWRIEGAENQSLMLEIHPQTFQVIRIQLTYIPVTGGKQ